MSARPDSPGARRWWPVAACTALGAGLGGWVASAAAALSTAADPQEALLRGAGGGALLGLIAGLVLAALLRLLRLVTGRRQ